MEWKQDCKVCKKPIDSPANALLAVYALFPKFGAVYWHPKCFASKTREAQEKYGILTVLAAGPRLAANAKKDVELQLKTPEKMQDALANQKIVAVILFGVMLAYGFFSIGVWEKLDALMRVGAAVICLAFAGVVISNVMFFVELGKFRQLKAAWLAAQGKTMKS